MTAPDPGDWVGRSESCEDLLTAGAVAGWAATLDRDDPDPAPGAEAPALTHWMLFAPRVRQSAIGADGHPQRGGFLPPVALPRRMWAGSRLHFHHPLRVGEAARRESRIAAVDAKQGRGGALVFVKVEHRIHDSRGLAISEEQDIVYREAARPDAPPAAGQPAPDDEAFSSEIRPDPVLLFRYSALTFNGHRIHYDQRYANAVEGYPGLIVHGPLIATLLLEQLRRQRPGAVVRRFGFRALHPLFDHQRFTVCGRPDGERCFALWARDHAGALAMQAEAEIE